MARPLLKTTTTQRRIEDMKCEEVYFVTSYLVVFILLFPTKMFGQEIRKPISADRTTTQAIQPSVAGYLIEVAGSSGSQSFSREAKTIAHILSSPVTKNPVLIDDQGYARESVLEAVAARLARDPYGKRLFRVNWRALFGAISDENHFDVALEGLL